MGETGSLRRSHEVDRRRFIRSAAVVAWAAPVISTLGTGPAYAQACVPAGGQCGTLTGCNPTTCTTGGFGACCTPTLNCSKGSGNCERVLGTPCTCK